MTDFDFNRQRIWRLCNRAAREIYSRTPANEQYAHRVACFLFEIAAVEGALRWERQRTPAFDGTVGGFSKWQMETGYIRAAIALLKSRPVELAQRVTRFVFADPNAGLQWLDAMDMSAILWSLRMNDNDALAIALCRVGWFASPEPIPSTVSERYMLWKRYYNTALGAGTVDGYVDAHRIYCADLEAVCLPD